MLAAGLGYHSKISCGFAGDRIRRRGGHWLMKISESQRYQLWGVIKRGIIKKEMERRSNRDINFIVRMMFPLILPLDLQAHSLTCLNGWILWALLLLVIQLIKEHPNGSIVLCWVHKIRKPVLGFRSRGKERFLSNHVRSKVKSLPEPDLFSPS